MTTTYADPTRCPDCRAVLPHDPQVCRVCSLPLTGEAVTSLFRTLQEADRILDTLRSQKRPVDVVAATTPVSGSHLQGVDPYPAASQRPDGLAAASRPGLLRPAHPAVARGAVPARGGHHLLGLRLELARRGRPHDRPGRPHRCLAGTVRRPPSTRPGHRRGVALGDRSRHARARRRRRPPRRLARDDRRRTAHPRHRRRGRDRSARVARRLVVEADVRTGPDRSRRRSPGHLRRPVTAGVTPALGRGCGRPPRAGTHRSRAAQHPVDDHLDRDGRPRLAVRRGDGLRHGRRPGHVRPLRR